MTTGEKIASLRKQSGITQEQLGETLGVSRQAISRWESDAAFPETENLIRMSELFHCTIDYLLKDSGEEPTKEKKDEEKESMPETIEKTEAVAASKPVKRNYWSKNWRKIAGFICLGCVALFALCGLITFLITPTIIQIVEESLHQASAHTNTAYDVEKLLPLVEQSMSISYITLFALAGVGVIPTIIFFILDAQFQKELKRAGE